jgi:alpha-1,2-mannosyltransferase
VNVYGLRLLTQPRFRLAAVALIVVLVFAFRVTQLIAGRDDLPWGHDFAAYWGAGRHLLDGLPLFTQAQLAGPYTPQALYLYLYPPPFAALMIPFAAMSPAGFEAAYAVWVVLGLAILVASALWLARSIQAVPWLVLVLAVLALPSVSGEIVNGNVHFLLVGLLTLAWWGIRWGGKAGDTVAGVAVGVAALIKVFPGLLIVWFLLRRRYRSAAWAVGGAIAVSLLTLPFTGIEPWREFPTVLANMSGPIDPTFSLAPATFLAPILGQTAARVLLAVAGLALVVWATPRLDEARGFALTIVVALLLTPILWAHYLAILVVPFLLGFRARLPIAGIVAVYVLLSGGNQAALGDLGFVLARVLPLAGTILLGWLALTPALRARPNPSVVAASDAA